MKKVFVLVVVFLVGITTQAFSTNQLSVVKNPGIKHRYDKSQSIRFVENGVRYEIFTDGTFDFTVINPAHLYNRGRRGHRITQVSYAPGAVQYVRGKRYRRSLILTDHYGNIIGIGSTPITYKRNGKVKSIGFVNMKYHRGYLVRVGGMELIYDRYGNIRRTIGHVKPYRPKVWHDDWYDNNDCDFDYDYDDDDWSYNDRSRKKKKRKI